MEASEIESKRRDICIEKYSRFERVGDNNDRYYVIEDAFDAMNILVLSIIKELEGD